MLTPAEKTAVDNFIIAARALPKTICIEVHDDNYYHLMVYKRTCGDDAKQVAALRKMSLIF